MAGARKAHRLPPIRIMDTFLTTLHPELGSPLASTLAGRKSSLSPRPISDGFWAVIEPLIPPRSRAEGREFRRRPGAGRKPIPARQAFEAVIHVLRTGTPWKSLPKSFGSASAIHRRFDAWHEAGLFARIWQAGLAEHEEMKGIAWVWHESAGTMTPTGISLPGPRLVEPGSEPLRDDKPPVRARLWQPLRARRRRRRAAAGHN